jgi:lysozyme
MSKQEKLTPEATRELTEFVVDEAIDTARSVVPSFDQLNPDRQMALADMAGNLGGPRLSKFKNMLRAIEAGNWKVAAEEAKNSKWYHQVPNRADRNIRLMQEPVISKAVPIPKPEPGV